jgi:hypothetical protein
MFSSDDAPRRVIAIGGSADAFRAVASMAP